MESYVHLEQCVPSLSLEISLTHLSQNFFKIK